GGVERPEVRRARGRWRQGRPRHQERLIAAPNESGPEPAPLAGAGRQRLGGAIAYNELAHARPVETRAYAVVGVQGKFAGNREASREAAAAGKGLESDLVLAVEQDDLQIPKFGNIVNVGRRRRSA